MKFALFLKEKGLISSEQMIEALVLQMSSTGPLLSYLNQEGLTEEILKALQYQQESGDSLNKIQREKNIFPHDKFDKALETQRLDKKPIGEILLNLGYLTVDNLDKALNEFSRSPSLEETTTVSVQEEEMSQAALDSLKELVDMGSFDPQEYQKMLDEFHKKKSITETVTILTEQINKDFLVNYLSYFNKKYLTELYQAFKQGSEQKVLDYLKTLQGAAKLAQARLSEQMIEKMISLQLNQDDLFKDGIKFLMLIARTVDKKGEETPILAIPEIKKQLQDYLET